MTKIYEILKRLEPNIIRLQLSEANFLGLLTGKLLGVKHRIYIRNHSTSNNKYSLDAVKWDLLVSSLSSHIILISENISQILIKKENVLNKKLTIINHGFELDKFKLKCFSKLENQNLKHKIMDGTQPIIGVIFRYVESKGIQYIIPAEKIKKVYQKAHLALVNLSEFIVHKNNSFVVPFCSSALITKLLLRLIQNKDICEQLKSKGQKVFIHFQLKNILQTT